MEKTQIKTTKKSKSTRAKASVCYFTQTNTTPDYKDSLVLRRFISDRGKILPQKFSNLTSKNQRLLAREIKKARFMSLLPYTDRHMI